MLGVTEYDLYYNTQHAGAPKLDLKPKYIVPKQTVPQTGTYITFSSVSIGIKIVITGEGYAPPPTSFPESEFFFA